MDTTHSDEQQVEDVLRSAIVAGEVLASSEGTDEILPGVLAALGEATGISRAHVFRNVTLADGRLAMDMRAEWVAPGIDPVMDDPTNHDWPYEDGCRRFEQVLSKGEIIAGPLDDFPPEERAEIEGEGVVSAAYVPLFVGGKWWGFLDYADCVEERRWSPLGIEALRVVASILAGALLRDELAVERRRVEEMMRAHIESIPAITYMEYADDENPLGYDEYYISPQVETILGFTQDEWLHEIDPETWWELVHPDDRDRLREISDRCNETHEDYSIEYRVRTKESGWIWLYDECRFVDRGVTDTPYWHGAMMDITERKRAEEQREFQSLLLESISDAVIAYDTDEVVTAWNRAAEALYGWAASEMVGLPLPDGLRYDPDALTPIWDPFVTEKGGWRGHTVHRDKDGYEIPIETKGIPIRDAQGNLKGYAMVNREVADT